MNYLSRAAGWRRCQESTGRLGFVMIGQSSSDAPESWKAIERVAPARVSVFITGETRHRQRRSSRVIHERSGRTGPSFRLTPVNCAAIIETLIEMSFVRAWQKGSFTGADRRNTVRTRRARRTVNHISSMKSARCVARAQAKLLTRHRASAGVLPVGGTQEIPIDVRFLAASNRALKQAIRQRSGCARTIYYRLCAWPPFTSPLPGSAGGFYRRSFNHFLTAKRNPRLSEASRQHRSRMLCVPSKLIDGWKRSRAT